MVVGFLLGLLQLGEFFDDFHGFSFIFLLIFFFFFSLLCYLLVICLFFSLFFLKLRKEFLFVSDQQRMAASTEAEARVWLDSVYHLDKKIEDHLRQGKVLAQLKEVAESAGVLSTGLDKSKGVLLYKVATAVPEKARKTLANYVVDGRIGANGFPFAVEFAKKSKLEPSSAEYQAGIESAAGVGLAELSEAEIQAEVAKLIASKESELETKRYQLKNVFLGAARKEAPLKFANAQTVVAEILAQLEARLGKESDQVNQASKKPAAPAPAPAAAAAASSDAPADEEEDTLPANVEYPPPEANTQLRPELLEQHLLATGGKIVTRFPPEPNGYLHIGHSKAANLDFGYAKRKGGSCILRYDDTNPEAEKQEYIDAILGDVNWLGWSPVRVTYSSDYFDKLYELAESMITRGYGYTCSCPKPVMSEMRKEKKECKCRSKTVEETLSEFRAMRDRRYQAGEMCLRMKADMQSPNTCMRDHVAYRIKHVPHPRTGDKWCIYPTYDYTHCIVDSLENITHSLCSLEFNIRRPTYEWLCHILDIYCPPQREFSRLDISYTVLSKRKLLKLIKAGVVSGWDDPLMPTIMGVRRRGFRSQALNKLCERVSITRTNTLVDYRFLEHVVREDLEDLTNRSFVVLDPLRVVLSNWEADKVEYVEAPRHPSFPERGTRRLPLSRTLYIEHKDFRSTADDASYFGLVPGGLVRLRYSGFIRCDSFETDAATGRPSVLHCTFVPETSAKIKGIVHWLAEPAPGVAPRTAEVRLLDRLFTVEQPGALSDEEFLKALNPNARQVISNALVDGECLDTLTVGQSIQFERHGFFCLDCVDSKPDAPVFNRIVGLRDSYALGLQKKAAAVSSTN